MISVNKVTPNTNTCKKITAIKIIVNDTVLGEIYGSKLILFIPEYEPNNREATVLHFQLLHVFNKK